MASMSEIPTDGRSFGIYPLKLRPGGLGDPRADRFGRSVTGQFFIYAVTESDLDVAPIETCTPEAFDLRYEYAPELMTGKPAPWSPEEAWKVLHGSDPMPAGWTPSAADLAQLNKNT